MDIDVRLNLLFSFIAKALLSLLSPTRLLIHYLKQKQTDPNRKAEVLLRWNLSFFWGELVVAVTLSILSLTMPALLGYVLLAVGASRVNEIVYAFYRDANRVLEQRQPTSALNPGQRIKMAMRSYVGLLINFSFIYYLMPKYFFDPGFKNFIEAFIFSGVTLTTLGYGDIKPVHYFSQLLTVYEVVSGLLLVVIALAVYLSAHAQKPT